MGQTSRVSNLSRCDAGKLVEVTGVIIDHVSEKRYDIVRRGISRANGQQPNQS